MTVRRQGILAVLMALSTLVAALGAGCASTPPDTYANVAPGAEFARYSTFGFLDRLSTDSENYESVESSFLKVAVAQELDRRGLAYSEAPDLLINFYINTKDKISSRSVPTTGAYFDYYAYRDPFYNPWGGYGGHVGYQTQIDQYTEGTLNIDVVDASTKKLVWEGAAVGRLTDRDIRNLEKTIDGAVRAIMTNFPLPPSRAP